MSVVNQVIDGALIQNGTVTLAATTLLDSSYSGKVINITQGANAFTVTLPAVAASRGVSYKFVLTTVAAANAVIAGGATLLRGLFIETTTGIAQIPNRSTITFVGNTAGAGSYVSVFCDGTSWEATIYSTVQNGITVT